MIPRGARPGIVGRALAWLAGIGVACVTVSCGADAGGETALCTCAYLTDTDLPGKLDVVVCATPEKADEVAGGCVRDLGVGHVESCVCRPGGEPCRAGLCSQR